MYMLHRSGLLGQNLLINDRGQVYDMGNGQISHEERVKQELQKLGVSRYALWRAESRHLPSIIHKDELIGGVVYGKHVDNFAMLVATDRRIIFLDKRPLFVNVDEITYDVVSGISFSHAGIGSTVTLHTRIKDYPIRTFNQRCAKVLIDFIEARSLEHNYTGDQYRDSPEHKEAKGGVSQ